ncbi:protein HAPLESS 2 [Cynara cardunculus var. scolymus]|uniref:protein HAPLESS 2 n=1 Tax=Cynara cardunculus var. scolymus TaxID=59895 RepID=UPI000D623234|nr:protein HAPLESS 2 [Cynara cardunculus var. scolymus]
MKHCIRVVIISLIVSHRIVNGGVQLLSKSKLEKCEKVSDKNEVPLNCTRKILINMAVPSESSGKEASIVAQVVEVEENSTDNMRTLRVPPVITVNKSAIYAQYKLTYIRDVPYKPNELYVKTRKCEPDAGANVVQFCERLRDEEGHIIERTQPVCCPCGNQRRVPSSCGNFFDKMVKGKVNTAHCLRFPGDWFHVFGIGQYSVGFSIRVEVKTGSRISEVIISPGNRTATSTDNFLRVNLIGDYVGYSDIPSFENYFLVVPRQGNKGEPQDLGRNFSMWMLLERVRFTLDGLECNKIGVSYEAFNGQPNFCTAPFWSCLHNQLWNFWDADQNRIRQKQVPLYDVQGRFERINEHPNAGSQSFSIGITEVLNSNLLIELSADDVEYVYQRSLGKIESITAPTFEALTQFGTATITARNIGQVEASYSLTFDCSVGVSKMEEQFFIMKPKEAATRTFKLYPTTDQAVKYVCAAILKDSDFHEVDRAECQFTTTATVLDNGSQIPFEPPKNGIKGFFESIGELWHNLWENMIDFITGKTCRMKCSGLFDFHCHIQYLCMRWVLMFGLLLAIVPTVIVLFWLLHDNGLFDPYYDSWEDQFWDDERKVRHIRHHRYDDFLEVHSRKHHRGSAHKRRRSVHQEHRQNHLSRDNDYHHHHPHHPHHHHHHHHVKKEKHKHGQIKGSDIMQPLYVDKEEDDFISNRRHKKERDIMEELNKSSGHDDEILKEHHRHKHVLRDDRPHKHQQSKRRNQRNQIS